MRLVCVAGVELVRRKYRDRWQCFLFLCRVVPKQHVCHSMPSLSMASHILLYRVRIQLNNCRNKLCLQNHWCLYYVFHNIL